MACTTFIKDTAGWRGTLNLLLLGLLLPSVIVSGQSTTLMTSGATPTTTTMPSSTGTTVPSTTPMTSTATVMTSGATPTTTTMPSSTGTTVPSTTPMTSTATVMTSGATPTTTTMPSSTGTTVPSTTPMTSTATVMTSGATPTTSTMPPSTGSTVPSTTQSANSTAISTSTMATSKAMMQANFPMPTNCSMITMMSTSLSSNSTDKAVMNGTMMISCPSFTCNRSTCYAMYTSQNATPCEAGFCFCQLCRQMDMWYTVSCSASCAAPCVNASQTNCSVECCSSPDCLKSSIASMMMMTSTAAPTTTITTTPTTTTTNNANQCFAATCIGTTCYTTFVKPQMCSPLQPHCQLKKETVAGGLQWTAGCTTNCSAQTPCKSTAQPPCHLECCNATKTSCLWLNGTMHVPNVAPGGLGHPAELLLATLLLGLLAVAWLNE
ncbi:uncharacterized protein AB9W97_017035 isoform 1-T3 [Spinachia spinachia]